MKFNFLLFWLKLFFFSAWLLMLWCLNLFSATKKNSLAFFFHEAFFSQYEVICLFKVCSIKEDPYYWGKWKCRGFIFRAFHESKWLQLPNNHLYPKLFQRWQKNVFFFQNLENSFCFVSKYNFSVLEMEIQHDILPQFLYNLAISSILLYVDFT